MEEGNKTETSNKDTAVGCFTLIIIMIIMVFVIRGCANSESESVDQQTAQIPGTIEITPEQFKTKFNVVSQDLDTQFYIHDLVAESDSVQNTFQYALAQTIYLTGSVNKSDGTIRDIIMIAQGDGSISSGADILLAMTLVIATVDPELEAKDRKKIVKKLGLMEKNIAATHKRDTIRNNKKYWISISAGQGMMFGVSDADDVDDIFSNYIMEEDNMIDCLHQMKAKRFPRLFD